MNAAYMKKDMCGSLQLFPVWKSMQTEILQQNQ